MATETVIEQEAESPATPAEAKPSSGLLLYLAAIAATVALLAGMAFLIVSQAHGNYESRGPENMKTIVSKIEAQGENLSSSTLLSGVFIENSGLLSDTGTLTVSYNDPESGALMAQLPVTVEDYYEASITGTLDDYTVVLAIRGAEFTYDSTTGEIVKSERS